MANVRGRVRRSFVRPPKRTSIWLFISAQLQPLTVAGGTLTNQLNAAALALRPFTIVRTRLECWIRSDQSAASEDQVGAIGLSVVSDQAAAVGISAVPTPITDLGSDFFFVHQPMLNSFLFVSGVGVVGDRGTRYSIDSKAMRKVDEDQTMVLVKEGEFTQGSGMEIMSIGRFLVKLH